MEQRKLIDADLLIKHIEQQISELEESNGIASFIVAMVLKYTIQLIKDVPEAHLNPIKVSQEKAIKIILNPKAYEKNLFWHYDENSGKYVGIDNTTGEAWTEDFDTKQECFDWLNGKERDT